MIITAECLTQQGLPVNTAFLCLKLITLDVQEERSERRQGSDCFYFNPTIREYYFGFGFKSYYFVFLKVHYNTVLHTESGKNRDGESFQATLYLRGSFAEKAMSHCSDPL